MLTSIPAASNSSVEMQRGGKWWIETPRLEVCRVAHLWQGVHPVSFVGTGLTGLTGIRAGVSCRPV